MKRVGRPGGRPLARDLDLSLVQALLANTATEPPDARGLGTGRDPPWRLSKFLTDSASNATWLTSADTAPKDERPL